MRDISDETDDVSSISHYSMEEEHYDTFIGGIVPGQPMLLSNILDFLPPNPRKILELGCGTGLLTAMVKKAYPAAEITGIDISPAMLSKAIAKPDLKGITFLAQDIRDAWPGRDFDAILTSLCLHHIPPEERVVVAEKAVRALAPGGRFICGDLFRADHDWEERVQREIWRRNMVVGRVPDHIVRGMIAQWERNLPNFTTVSWFRDKLLEVGFSRATIPFTSGIVGLVIGFNVNDDSLITQG